MKVIVGVDGSERGKGAVRFVSRLLSPQADELTLYSSPPQFRLTSDTEIPPSTVDQARNALSEAIFAAAKAVVPAPMRDHVGAVVGHSKPVEGLLAVADQQRADLIAVGAHGAPRRLRLFLGNVARSIVHRSDIPVLVVRDEDTGGDGTFRVLVACDATSRWNEAVAFLNRFTWPAARQATLLHVVESMDPDQLESVAAYSNTSVKNGDQLVQQYLTHIEQRKAESRTQLAAACEPLKATFPNADVDAVEGHAVERIVDYVSEHNIDLLVVGARKLGPVRRLFGSTTEGLLSHCPCSLLIVHPHDEP